MQLMFSGKALTRKTGSWLLQVMLVGDDHLVVASLYQPPTAAWLVLRGKTRLLIDNQAMGRVAHLPKLLQPRHVELSEMYARCLLARIW